MMKKLLSFVCCLLPFSAGAAPVYYPEQDKPALGPNNTYGEDGQLYSVDVGTDEALIIRGGSGIVISQNPDAQPGDSSGLTVANGLVIGATGTADGYLFADENINKDGFTIQSADDIRVGVDANDNPVAGTAVEVKSGYKLEMSTKPDENGQYDTLVNATLGNIIADGALDVEKINTFKSGTIASATELTISANTITTGAINVTGGKTVLNATGALTMAQFQTSGAKTTINASSIESGNIQNNGADGEMTIALSGDLNSTGMVENRGTLMKISAKDVTVDGTMQNASNNGTLEMQVNSLTVKGGSSVTDSDGNTTITPSFVNAGNLHLTVDGETNLAYGFDLSDMQSTNEFYLKTGTLKFGNTDSADAWLQVFANELNSFYLEITGDVVNAGGAINNGQKNDGNINKNATMTVIGQSVTASSVTNNGVMDINADKEYATLYIGARGGTTSNAINIGAGVTDTESVVVRGETGTNTQIISDGTVNIGGTVSNSGKMLINGNNVNLVGVVNDGTELEILAPTDETGTIKITSTVDNKAGDLIIDARTIDIDGVVTNSGGATKITWSDSSEASENTVTVVSLGGINVEGGQFYLDELIGDVAVDNSISVTGGALNIGKNISNVTAGRAILVGGDVNLQGNAPITGNGDINIAAIGAPGFVLKSTATDANGSITIDGNVSAIDDVDYRIAQFDARTITVGTDASGSDQGNVTAANKGKLIFGSKNIESQTNIKGKAVAQNGGTLEFYSDDTDVGSLTDDNGLLIVHGSQITANTGAITIKNNLLFNPTDSIETYKSGMLVYDTQTLTLETKIADDADASVVNPDININGAVVINATDNMLALNSARDVTVGGPVTLSGTLTVNAARDATFNNSIKNNNSLTVFADENIKTLGITNTGSVILGDADHVADTVTTGDITNTGGSVSINAENAVTTASIDNTSNGTFDVIADSLDSTYVTISSGTATLDVKTVAATYDINVSGGLVQDSSDTENSGMLNIVRDNSTVSARNLNVAGFNAYNHSVTYNMSGDVTVGGAFSVAKDANVAMTTNGDMIIGSLDGGKLTNGPLTNAGELALTVKGTGGLQIGGAIENSGDLTLNVQKGLVFADSFVNNTGITTLNGKGLSLSGSFGAEDMPSDDALDTLSMLYHGGNPELNNGDFFIDNNGYELTASNVVLAGIEQTATGLTINTSDLKIANDIDVVDMRVAANPSDDWLNVDVGGNVVGGAQFIGLESMHITGNYKFTNNSQINAVILPYSETGGVNTTTKNYWSTISLIDDNTLGQITNKDGGAALIQVDGAFISSANAFNVAVNGGKLAKPQVGLVLRDTVDPGTAIWLLHADNGVSNTLAGEISNLNVSFCNDKGTICFDYLEAINKYNGTNTDLPAYISVRDSKGDGFADSLYVVFDPRFGGPVQVFKIQPIVARTDDYTAGEYSTAGALDNLIAGQLAATGFLNRTPIEAIPVIFQNTNMATAANELFNRMEQYNLERDGTALARFSRLFQPRELEQIAGSVVLNEHTNFRSFEDRMFDEFIWNRHRNLKKAWVDVDYGMFYQNATDGKHVNGNRFNISGGFDWQESQTLLLGLTGRISRMSSDNSDSMDLGYLPGQHIDGHVKTTVSDTDIGLGGYLMKILGQKTRVYGNGFLDIHVLNVDRDQTYVSKISGTGTAFSLMSEWGLLHDWLNQYIVGNMYARAGYTFGFDITEKAAGQDYMNLKSDGYFTFTPGYSLTAQKRIYPSVWFQVRPYATIGVEYDVLGAPDSVKYKFAAANSYTTYDVKIDPLWANIGGGVEMLSVTGIQVGIDYRYQYNSEIQLHNIRISGSYRF